jgi:hypothetical protein
MLLVVPCVLYVGCVGRYSCEPEGGRIHLLYIIVVCFTNW